VTRETDDLLLALQAAGRNNSRYVYIAHGLSTWNALMFYRRLPSRVVSMVFIDPFDPRMQLESDSQERERLSFVNAFGFFGMLVNAFGFLRPVFRLIAYFRPAFDLPGRVLGLFIDSISRQAFWSTIVAENAVLAQSGNETLTAFPFQSYALGSLPVALWCRELSQSWAYFATLSTDTIQVNMTEDMTHFFIFHKRYADEIVTVASDVISMGLNSQQ
jgi:pimeloyl-ACP methyl ester carboxylesterase